MRAFILIMDADSFWKGYLMARRERVRKEKRALIGGEYNSNTKGADNHVKHNELASFGIKSWSETL